MKQFVVIAALLACVLSAQGASVDFDKRIECLNLARQQRIGESTIRDILETVRAVLKNGFDPLDVSDKQINIKNDLISLDSVVSVHSAGLSGFAIDKLSLSLIGLNLKLILRWPEITVNGQYDINLNSTLFPQNIVGKGNLDLTIKNFIAHAEGKIAVSIIGMKPQIKRLTVNLNMDQFDLAVTGLMNDEELSANLSQKISERVPQLLVEYRDKINQLIADNLDRINDILAGKKLFSEAQLAKMQAYEIMCGDY